MAALSGGIPGRAFFITKNQPKGGGFLVYGVNDDATMFSITKVDTDTVIKKLGNIALNNLSQSIQIQHDTIAFEGNALLFFHIPEQMEKPVYPREKTLYDSYQRSAGQSVKMSKEAVKFMISASHGISFESQTAMSDLSEEKILELLDYRRFYERCFVLHGRKQPRVGQRAYICVRLCRRF